MNLKFTYHLNNSIELKNKEKSITAVHLLNYYEWWVCGHFACIMTYHYMLWPIISYCMWIVFLFIGVWIIISIFTIITTLQKQMQTLNYKNVHQLLLWIVPNLNNLPHQALIMVHLMVAKVPLIVIVPKRRKLGLFYILSVSIFFYYSHFLLFSIYFINYFINYFIWHID